MSILVRSISRNELHEFACFAAGEDRGFAPRSPAEFETWLQQLWDDGQSSPELCFVVTEGGETRGAIVYWKRGNGVHVEHVRFPSDDESLLVLLLRETLRLLAA